MAAGKLLPPTTPLEAAGIPDVCAACGATMPFPTEMTCVPGVGNFHAGCFDSDPELRLRLQREGFLTEDDLGA